MTRRKRNRARTLFARDVARFASFAAHRLIGTDDRTDPAVARFLVRSVRDRAAARRRRRS